MKKKTDDLAMTGRAIWRRGRAGKVRMVAEITQRVMSDMTLMEALKWAGISPGTFYKWERRYSTDERIRRRKAARRRRSAVEAAVEEAASRRKGAAPKKFRYWQERLQTAEFDVARLLCKDAAKRCVVADVIRAVNGGMTLDKAIRKAGISDTAFRAWERRFAEPGRARLRKDAPSSKTFLAEKKRLVAGIVEAVNGGMMLKEAIRQAGITPVTFYKWERRFPSTRRTQRRRGTADMERTMTEILAVMKSDNIPLTEAARRAGTTPRTFRQWERLFGAAIDSALCRKGTEKERRRAKKDRLATGKEPLIAGIIKAVNDGMRLKEAVRRAGTTIRVFRKWERHLLMLGRITRRRMTERATPEGKARVIAEIDRAVKGGMMLKDARERARLSKCAYYTWKKRLATAEAT